MAFGYYVLLKSFLRPRLHSLLFPHDILKFFLTFGILTYLGLILLLLAFILTSGMFPGLRLISGMSRLFICCWSMSVM